MASVARPLPDDPAARLAWGVAATVTDPEIPVLTIEDLGVLRAAAKCAVISSAVVTRVIAENSTFAPQPSPQRHVVDEARETGALWRDDHFVEMRIAEDHGGRSGLDHVGQVRLGIVPPQRPQQRRREHDIADEPQAHQEDSH